MLARGAVAEQAPIQTRAGDVGVDEFTHHSDQIIQREQSQTAQFDRDRLLPRRKRRAELVRSV
jgi:hypothetical protein